MKKAISLFLVVVMCFVSTASPSFAGFADDWIAQKVETSPQYFEGQKRGYFTMGSFSARVPISNDHLFTITPPKIKGGCGGIDAFLGGFGFLNLDFLVKKMQNIISAAPALAFDIALKTINTDLSETLGKLMSIIDRLNGLQIDDCKASKALVAKIMDPVVPDSSKVQGELNNSVNDFWSSSGLENLYNLIQGKTTANNNNSPSATTAVDYMAGCPSEVKEIFGETGSVVDKIAAKYGMAGFANEMRAYVGDVKITKQAVSGVFSVNYVAPCEENNYDVTKFITGKMKLKNSSGICSDSSDSNANLLTWTQTRMTRVASALKNKGTLLEEDQTFLKAAPLPVHLSLMAALQSGQEGAVIGALSDVVAKGYAFAMMSDFLYRVTGTLEKTRELASHQNNARSDQKAYTCNLSMVSDAKDNITKMVDSSVDLLNSLRRSYTAAAGELNAVMILAGKMKEFDQIAKAQISQRFGPGPAARATGK